MPTASSPEDVGRLVGETISSGDIDGALSLYEPEATFVTPRAFGEGSVTGLDALRETIGGFMAMNPTLKVNPEQTTLAGDIALVVGNWTLTGTGPDGNDVEAGGRYADVLRRQDDGSWLFVIDNPNGSD
ncbi:MAG TPA: nuclear transport factor 2 family protein [Solirubrobacteraceae bacterium]|nr:nuclear transport factor 2 family protein [Solirubrobacteraceae bacterium]